MSVLGDIIGREWLECELEDARRELEWATDRARNVIRGEVCRRCSTTNREDPRVAEFYAKNPESIRRSEEMLVLAFSSPLRHKITFLEHLLS